jgi:hypothetical protein
MIIISEKKTPKHEAGKNSEWDIAWKDALDVFKTLSKRRDIGFLERGHDRSPLGDQPITGFKISGNNLFVLGQQTGYIIFGNQVKRVIRRHIESSKLKWFRMEEITLLFSPHKELEFSWTG